MAESKIREVSVYKSGCIVKRQGTVHLEKGSNTAVLRGLKSAPGNYIDADSVKLAVDQRVTGSNIQVETMDGKDIEEQLSSINDQIAEKTRELEILSLQEEMWKNNSDFTGKDSVSVESITGYIESLEGRLGEIGKKKSEIEKKLKELQKDLKTHREYFEEPYVKADLYCEEEGDYGFEITYYCRDVYWFPFYEIHTDDSTDAVEIRLRAKVRQNTSEDWQGIKLSLYGTDPSISGTIPTLYPDHLSFYEPVRMSGAGAMMKSSANRAFAMNDMVVEEAEAPLMGMAMAGQSFQQVRTGGASFKNENSILEYELSGLWDLAKGKEIICDLSSQTAECKYHDICVPKLDTKAYLAAEVKTSDVEQLLDTNASIYIKGTYMGDAYLDIDLSKDTYDISLGVDETLKVQRRQLKKYNSNVLLKGQKKTDLEYEISVSSKKDRKCELLILDQIPISDEKTIEVTVAELSGGKLEEETGKVRWELSLDRQETVKKILSYSVAYPKEKVISKL